MKINCNNIYFVFKADVDYKLSTRMAAASCQSSQGSPNQTELSASILTVRFIEKKAPAQMNQTNRIKN